MNLQKILKAIIIFLLGFLSANILGYYLLYGIDFPIGDGFNLNTEKNAPTNFINENQIQVYEDKVVILINGASLSRYAPTGSMKPVFDENSNGIRIVPKTPDEINVGDIITFQNGENLIVHRVIEKDEDQNGVYFITKGDNNTISDGKIRFKDIKYKTIGVIW